MKFSKFQGAGNDFIILNNMEEQIPTEKLGQVARQLCRRRFSIGADGLMAVDFPSEGGDYRMRFYNADGSQGEMCGNGARCIARYGYEKGLAGETQRIETTAGMVVGKRIGQRMYQIRLNDPTKIHLDQSVEIDGREYQYSYLELGDPGIPHVAVELPEFWLMGEEALRDLGRRLRHYEGFAKGANVNFFALTHEPDGAVEDSCGGLAGKTGFSGIRVKERTFERGVEDFTLACGTGTGCVVAALTLQGRVSGEDVCVDVPGGELRITVERAGEWVTALYLTGPTNIVAEGEITDEDFSLK